MAENPFFVRPVNPLEALMMGQQGFQQAQAYGRDRALDEAAAALKAGDNAAVMDALLRARQVGPAIEFAKLGRQQEASAEFSRGLGSVFGGGGAQPQGGGAVPQTAPRPLVPSGTPGSPLAQLINTDGTTAPARPRVASTPRVWGDSEGEAAGIYETPGQPTRNVIPPSNNAMQGGEPYRPTIGPTATAQAPIAPRPVQTQSFTPQAPQGVPTQPGRPGTGPSINGVQLDRAMPMLLQAATNPNLPKEQQEFARMLVGKAIDQYPNEIRQLEIFKQRPDLFEMAKQLKQAGAQAITIDQRGETEEAKAFGKAAGERGAEMLKAAGAAPRKLQNLNRMESMMDQVRQGKIEPARMTVSAWAKSFGMDDTVAERLGLDPKGVGTAQAIEALSNELTLGHIGPGGLPANNFSNTDRSFVTEIVPQLGNDPEANKIKIEAARRLTQLDIEKGREWQAFRRDPNNKGRGFDDFETGWNDKIAQRNIFGDLLTKARGAVTRGGAGGGAGGANPPPGMPPNARRAADGNFYVPDPNRPGKYLMVK